MRHEYNNPTTQIFFMVSGELCVREGLMKAPPTNPSEFNHTMSGSGGSN